VLQSDSLNFALGVNVAPDGAAALDIRAGATSDHSQRIKQISGQTGRLWRIENTSGQELIVLDSVGNLQSGNPGFVSGLSGWQVTPTGNAEFNNGRFRGELHATVMVFDEVSVRNGTELITPAGGALELDVTLVATGTPAIRNVRTTAFGDQDYLDYRTDSVTGSGTGITARTIENILSVKNPDTGHYQVFRAGEVLRMKVWTGSAIEETWLRVNSALDMGTYYAYFVQIMSGTLPVSYTAGAAAAGYGKSGEGAIRLSADDPYGPLIDIFTTGAAPWAGDIYPHVRLGRLDGVGVPGLSGIRQYGLALGANLADATKPYMFASNLGVRQYNIDSAWNDGTNDTARIEAGGRARFGTNVESPANTFLDINPALGLATFRGVAEFLAGSSGIANFSDANLDNIANGSTYARVNSTLISGGNIRVGVGTKDSTLNGFALDATEFVGQAGGVDQVVMGANGKIEAGFDGGVPAVTLDSEGIVVQATTVFSLNHDYAFRNNTGIYGGVRGAYNPTYGNQLAMVADTTGSRKPNVEMLANGSATYPGYARVYADAGGGSGLRAQIILQAGTYGSNTITLDADEITVIGELTAPGVLNFRSTAYGM
jgi:hypothetical protein